jgi:predicted helicase
MALFDLDWALKQIQTHCKSKKITKWDIFHYIYGLLHHPGYRTKFADNLKRDLPRIPFAPDFKAFASAGKKLAELQLNYETGKPYPLKLVVTPDEPLSYVVADKMRLNKDKTELRVNDSLALTGIPPAVFNYRLGNRSALDWVIDQYRVTEDARSGIVSDPVMLGSFTPGFLALETPNPAACTRPVRVLWFRQAASFHRRLSHEMREMAPDATLPSGHFYPGLEVRVC